MNFAQKQYELSFNLLANSNRFNATNYFRTIDAIRSRPYQIPSPKNLIIKKVHNEPFKDFLVIKSNEKLRLRLDSIQSKPVIPKINIEYLEIEKRMKNNRERARYLYNRALTFENDKYSTRVFSQEPRVIKTKILEKLYEENHEKYINILKRSKNRINEKGYGNYYYSSQIKLPRIIKKNNLHSRTEANLDSDNEQPNNNSLELKDHKYKEISHQKQGHIEGQHNYQVESSG